MAMSREGGVAPNGSGRQRGVAIVGASDRSHWTSQALRNIERCYTGATWLVNPRRARVCDRPTIPSLASIDGSLEAVVVAVGAGSCPEVVAQAVDLAVQDIVVVSDGFAERGTAEGLALQQDLVAACGPHTRLYGPNCVGFADYRRGLCVVAEPVPDSVALGSISVISQSGGVMSTVMSSVLGDGGGLDWCASMGNAAQFDVAAAIDYVCDRGTTTALCMYIEALSDEDGRLKRAFAHAAAADITLVALKPGRTRRAARIALTHTASVVGNDAEADALLAEYGVIRVDSIEELARVAVLSRLRRPKSTGGVAIVGSSGGQAAIASDLAMQDGLNLAVLSDETRRFLSENAGPGSFLENPIDFVAPSQAKVGLVDMFEVIVQDQGVAAIIAPYSIIFPDYDSPGASSQQKFFLNVAKAVERTGMPMSLTSLGQVPWTPWVGEYKAANPDVLVMRGLAGTIKAMSRLFPADLDEAAVPHEEFWSGRVLGEIEGRRELSSFDVFLAPGVVLEASDQAKFLDGLQPPFIVKVDIEGVSHKAKFGGVTSNCVSREDVLSAASRMKDSINAAGIDDRHIAGTLVEEQVEGTEVLIGLTRSELGVFLTVSAGGAGAGSGTVGTTILVRTSPDRYADCCARYLPASLRDTEGFRSLVSSVSTLASAFESGALEKYESLEINPFIVTPSRALIADVLLVLPE
jgi:acetate---CoA ligase (ADP-forming)